MFSSRLPWPSAAALIVAVGAVQAQPALGGPDPADAAAAVPRIVYASPFQSRRTTPTATAADWLQANREVAAIGGWKAYAREAQAPESAASAAAPEQALPPMALPPMTLPHQHTIPAPGARP